MEKPSNIVTHPSQMFTRERFALITSLINQNSEKEIQKKKIEDYTGNIEGKHMAWSNITSQFPVNVRKYRPLRKQKETSKK